MALNESAKYSHIIWDWNGTLFDDVGWCVKVINKMLLKRGIKTLSDVEEYYRHFRFPIIEYYKSVGFDFAAEPFTDLSVEFISLYHSDINGNCGLHHNSKTVLDAVHAAGIKQIILSASEINNLLSQVSEFNIEHYFDGIFGLSDIYAKSKIEIGLNYISGNAIKKALLVGDTEHDYEVARELGADCVLIAKGHQSKEKLVSLGVPVLDDIISVTDWIF